MTVTTETDHAPTVTPADTLAGAAQGQWTHENYATLTEQRQRYEIIDGVLYSIPTPDILHQSCVLRFVVHLVQHVEMSGLGRVLLTPLVQMAADIVIQPDLAVVVREKQDIIAADQVVGTPDLIIEIASPPTASYDSAEKRKAYARAGVREYWMIDPATQAITVWYQSEQKQAAPQAVPQAAGFAGFFKRLLNMDEPPPQQPVATSKDFQPPATFQGPDVLCSRLLPDLNLQAQQFFS